MKLQQLRQIIREEIEGMINNPSGGGFSESRNGKKFTLESGDEIATIEFVSGGWYAKLEKGGKLMYEEKRGGYHIQPELVVDESTLSKPKKDYRKGEMAYVYGSGLAEEWEEMPGFETLAALYNYELDDNEQVRDIAKFPVWRELKQY